jgi:hypothetical protein
MKSNRIRIAFAALGTLVFAVSLVSPASAFIRLARTNAAGTGAVQAHWLDASLPMRFISNSTNSDIPPATALAALQASAQAWTDINTSFFASTVTEFSGAAGELPPALDAGDGQNSVFFDIPGVNFAPGGTVIAFTRSIIDLTDGHTIDSDVVFNDRDFFSSTSSPTLTPAPPGQSSVDLQSVITHEFGHAYGLDHTSVANATMIPFIIGDTRQRTLELDDQAGNSTIYPESAARGLSPGAIDFGATTGTVSGTVVSGYNGSAIFGAHVEAINLSDFSDISAISGELTLRNGLGEYTIHGLAPGSYAIEIVPLDGIHTIASDANIGGPYNGLDINFEPELWNGADESGNGFTDHAGDFTPVSVAAAANTPGINFITNTFPGQIDIAQFGAFENIVTFRNTGYLAKRFDLPFTPPYTISKVTFPSFTFNAQVGLPPFPAIFPSVSVCPLNTATGLPDLANPLFSIANFNGSPNGVNEIPVNLTITDPDKVLFFAIQFPSAAVPGFPVSFPFLRMDFTDMERGQFLNDYSIATNGTGGVLIDRNIAIGMTAVLPDAGLTPIVPVANLGANLRSTKMEFRFDNPPDVRLDGFSLPPNSLDHVNLVRRAPSGLLEAFGSAGGSGQISLPDSLIPAGAQFWFVQPVDKAGHKSLTSNVTIGGFNLDADEPNGRANATEATAIPIPSVNRPETYSPAGDNDFYAINAKAGDVIQASAVSTSPDGNNNQDLVMLLLDNNGDVLAFDDDSNGNLNPKLSFTVPPRGKSAASRKFYLQVTDFRGSPLSPSSVPQVRVPRTYNLNANVIASAASLAGRIGNLVGADGFAFANTGPNPANPIAKLFYVLPQGASYGVRLSIYDVNGRMVRKLVDGTQTSGAHTELWNGTDDAGRGVASGRYYARIEAGSFTRNVGITILK